MKKKKICNDKDLTNSKKRKQAIELLENWIQKLNDQEIITKHK